MNTYISDFNQTTTARKLWVQVKKAMTLQNWAEIKQIAQQYRRELLKYQILN